MTTDASAADSPVEVTEAQTEDVEETVKHWYRSRWVRAAFSVGLLCLAAYLIARDITPSEFEEALKDMEPWWFLAAVAAGMVTWVGAAIPMMVFAPTKIPFRSAFLAQMAVSFAGVVAPSGMGMWAVCIRFLTKQKLKASQAISTMVLIQLAQVAVTIPLVIVAIIATGAASDINFPARTFGLIMVGVLVLVSAAMAIPVVRRPSVAHAKTFWSRFYPQLTWALRHPRQLAIAMGGALLQTAGFVASFAFSLAAFGTWVGLIKVAATYLVANTVGALIPVPGGVGTIEASLTAGLAFVGVPTAVALSTAVVFRLATFYLQIPIGWVAFEYMQRKGLL